MADGNMMQNRRKPNALSEFTMRIKAPPVDGSRKNPTLGIAVKKNKVLIEVRTGVDNDKEFGKITGEMSSHDMFTLCGAMLALADGPNDQKKSLELSATRFISGQRSKDVMLNSTVTIGKDANGLMFIGVKSWDQSRPIIRFTFGPTVDRFSASKWIHGDGTEVTRAEMSVMYAKGWVELMRPIITQILQDEYWEKPQQEGGGYNNQGGSGGGYNQNRGGGGNYNQNNAGGGGGNRGGGDDFSSDDLPL